MMGRLTRLIMMTALGAVALVGMAMGTAQTASAQGPCNGQTFFQDYTTSGAVTRSGCSVGFTVSFAAFEYELFGPGPHSVSADTCGDSGDTVIQIFQSPGGASGTFTPAGGPGAQFGCNDDSCGAQSEVTANGLEAGFYTVVVSNWSSTASISGELELTSSTCVNGPFVAEAPVEFLEPTNQVCLTGEARVAVEVCNTGTMPLVNGPGAEFGTRVISSRGAPVVVRSIASGVGPGQIPGTAPFGGYSASADLDLAVGACDTVNMTLFFPTGVGNVGELLVDRAINVGPPIGILEFLGADEDPILLPCPSKVFPEIQLGSQVHLPILNFQGQDDVCETWIEVQNLGCDFAKAALITWGEPGFCPPQAAGPLKVECTGMLKPGSTWNLLGAQVPTGSKSGILFKFTTAQLSEIGVDLGFDDITGDYLCETLFFGVVGDADDYRRFKKAYNEGLEFAGVPLDRAKGDGYLAVDVHRTCPGDTTPGVEVTSKYNGLAADELGTFDDLFGGYGFYVPLIYADAADFNTIMYIQNGGLQCSSVEVWFKARDDCLRASICEILTLAPGESYQLDANDCVGPDFQGSAWLRSSQVMGIAVDIIGRDVLMTYVAEPAEINYTFDPNSATTRTAQQVAFGPLIYSEYQGWDTGIQVQNMSGVTAAKVKVYFLDRSGDIITTLVDWVCPRGSQTFFLPVIFDLPGNWVGSVRVESQEWFTPGNPLVLPPNITAVATLIKYNDAARTETTEAIAYNLLPEHKIYDWQIGFGGGGLDNGVGLIAIPSLIRDLQGTGVTSELAIANVVPKPGFTDLVIYFYDQNGLLDYVCQKLNEKQVEYIDLQTWGYINEGFKGSAIISAWFWEHDVFDDRGGFLRNLVGLGAVAVERKGTRLGEDVPGDEAAGARGIPFRQFETEDDEFEFCFMGYPPLCPGFADNRFQEGGCNPVGLGSITVEIVQGPPFHMFPTDPQSGTCSTGAAGNRNFNTHDFTVCDSNIEITIVDYTLTPFSGGSCGVGEPNSIFLAIYNNPGGFDPAAQCNDIVWSIFDGDLFDLGGRGDVFDVDLGAPGNYQLMVGNVCDTGVPQSTGPVMLDLN